MFLSAEILSRIELIGLRFSSIDIAIVVLVFRTVCLSYLYGLLNVSMTKGISKDSLEFLSKPAWMSRSFYLNTDCKGVILATGLSSVN